nr:MAG TPA: hypothetical protein [Caudoviricetes sp.]
MVTETPHLQNKKISTIGNLVEIFYYIKTILTS